MTGPKCQNLRVFVVYGTKIFLFLQLHVGLVCILCCEALLFHHNKRIQMCSSVYGQHNIEIYSLLELVISGPSNVVIHEERARERETKLNDKEL